MSRIGVLRARAPQCARQKRVRIFAVDSVVRVSAVTLNAARMNGVRMSDVRTSADWVCVCRENAVWMNAARANAASWIVARWSVARSMDAWVAGAENGTPDHLHYPPENVAA
jgi:hypothetical protein